MGIAATKKPTVHPGEILSDYIEDNGLTQAETARRLSVPTGNINEICRGTRGISPEMAFKLSRLFRTTAELWMNLQKNWELSQVDPAVMEGIEPIKSAA